MHPWLLLVLLLLVDVVVHGGYAFAPTMTPPPGRRFVVRSTSPQIGRRHSHSLPWMIHRLVMGASSDANDEEYIPNLGNETKAMVVVEHHPPTKDDDDLSKPTSKRSGQRAGGRRPRTNTTAATTQKETNLLLPKWLIPSAALLLLLFRLLFGGLFFGDDNHTPNYYYYQSSSYESSVVGADGRVDTAKKESVRSNIPGLVEQEKSNGKIVKQGEEPRRSMETFRQREKEFDRQLEQEMKSLRKFEKSMLLDDFW